MKKIYDRRILSSFIGLALLVVIGAGMAPAVSAGDAHITSGDFSPLTGVNVAGHVTMIRTHLSTVINISQVTGLAPNQAYPAAAQVEPCRAISTQGMLSYQRQPNGSVTPAEDIGPIVATNAVGVGRGYTMQADASRQAAQAVVIYHPDNGAPLACADLE